MALAGSESGSSQAPQPDETGAPAAMRPQAIEIDGVLDLHSFRPAEVADVVEEYLRVCHERGVLEVRVIHGRGIGQLRQTVHACLRRLAFVRSFALAGEAYGGPGATFVRLTPLTPNGRAESSANLNPPAGLA
jgi:DNA-nicking Smr family endonuclease